MKHGSYYDGDNYSGYEIDQLYTKIGMLENKLKFAEGQREYFKEKLKQMTEEKNIKKVSVKQLNQQIIKGKIFMSSQQAAIDLGSILLTQGYLVQICVNSEAKDIAYAYFVKYERKVNE